MATTPQSYPSSASTPAKPGPVERNLADSLSDLLPDAHVVYQDDGGNGRIVTHIAVPERFRLETLDNESLMPAPSRVNVLATLSNIGSFIDYVKRHAVSNSVVWCEFNPQTYKLRFAAVLDEIGAASTPAWRDHWAVYEPSTSAEWQVWTSNDGPKQIKDQVSFAEFLERNGDDITTQAGYPTCLEMMKMATEFEANSEKMIRSVVRLQGGGVRIDYVNDDDAQTLGNMKMFERFQIGIPVFWSCAAFRIDARLKYRHNSGKVSFWYELIRSDRAHETAAKDLIEQVRSNIANVPLLMGGCKYL